MAKDSKINLHEQAIPLDLCSSSELPAGIASNKSSNSPNSATQSPQSNVSALRGVLLELETQGIVSFVNVEVSPTRAPAPKMTLKQFRDAYANKPGATFYCPEHRKHELED